MAKTMIAVAVLMAAFASGRAEATPVLTLDPIGGAIAGSPGDTIGWGFTLTNDTDFLVVTSADFVPSTPLGTFTDFFSADFVVVGPSPEQPAFTEAFNQAALAGIGSFLIDPAALPGALASGSIVLTYDLYRLSPNDPLFNPDTDVISNGNLLSADASVAVADAAQVVPEPATMMLLGSGLAAVAARRRRRP